MKFITEPIVSVPLGKMVRLAEWGDEIWVAYQHLDGQWVSLREATEADKQALGYRNDPP